MEKKKLLFALILSAVGATQAIEDNLVQESKEIAKQAIEDKWQELQNMLTQAGRETEENDINIANNNQNAELKVLISTSMSKPLLKQYAKQAEKYGAVLVLKGLPNNSWQELSKLVQEISEDREVSMELDDELYKKHAVQSVPTFLLIQEQDWFEEEKEQEIADKVVGNIGIRRALEIIEEEGELATEAEKIRRNI